MKCFHFPSAASSQRELAGGREGTGSWARSFSVASSASEARWSAFESCAGEETWRMERKPEGLRAFDFAELKAATRGFSRAMIIGEGGFGCVYRGIISVSREEDGVGGVKTMDVAVKQHNKCGSQGHREWITEVNFLGVVKHPNLVKLVGYCVEDNERGVQRLLVYELMLNKSLEDHLLARIPSKLSWELRLKIAHDAARGLAYLHEEMDFQLIFRDFKSSNILLDEDFNAKLSDFGLARNGPLEGFCHDSTPVLGTIGYAAPEYVQMGRLTSKSDVWSYGVVLYEIITGRRSIDRNLPRNEQKLLDWVKPYATDPKKLHIIIDPRLEGYYSVNSVQKLIALANKCLMKRPKARPPMSKVVQMLDEIIEMTNEECTESSDERGCDNEGKIKLKDSIRNCIRAFGLNKEFSILRNRTLGKLDWKRLAPWPVMDLARAWG